MHLHAAQIDLTFLQRLVPLPDFVQGRAALQAHLSGHARRACTGSGIDATAGATAARPFDQLHVTLVYAQQQLQSEVRVRQANREVLTVELPACPSSLALTPLALEQRLLAAPWRCTYTCNNLTWLLCRAGNQPCQA